MANSAPEILVEVMFSGPVTRRSFILQVTEQRQDDHRCSRPFPSNSYTRTLVLHG